MADQVAQTRRLPVLHGVALALACWAVLALVALSGWFEVLDLRLNNLRYRLRGAVDASRRIALVEVDDATIAAYGHWPLPRETYALLADAMQAAGAQAIGFDLLFLGTNSDDPVSDRLLAEVTRDQENLVHSISFLSQDPALGAGAGADMPPDSQVTLIRHGRPAGGARLASAHRVILPYDDLLDAADALGHTSVAVDRDGVVRRIPLFVRYGEWAYPSLALRLIESAARTDTTLPQFEIAPDGLWLHRPRQRRQRIAIDPEGATGIAFAGDRRSFRSHSMLRVLQWHRDGSLADLRREFEGRLVLVGATAVGEVATDVGATPFAEAAPLLFIHANALNAALAGEFEARPPAWLLLAGGAALAALLGGLFALLPLAVSASLLIASEVAVVGFDLALFMASRLDLPAAPALALAPLAWAAIEGYRRVVVEREMRLRDRKLRAGAGGSEVSPLMHDRPPDSDFTPISPNPYIVGNPVRDRSMFFGREAEFELVRKRFQHSEHGGLLVFCGERRSGKTSILFQIFDQRLGPDFIPVLIDMQSMAVGSEIEFLTRISEDVLAALGREGKTLAPPDFTPDSNRAATFQKFIRNVLEAHPGRKLILLFDEYELFESKIDAGQLAHDVLHILASLMENQPVFLIFTGSQHLEQRRKDYWKILGKSLYKMISFLEREDALNLMRKPVEGRVHYAEGAVEAIYRLTSGQPFYTQAICQSLVDQLNDRRANHATPSMVAEVVDGIVNNPLPQMIFLWDGLDRDEKLVLALLAEALGEESEYAGVADLTRLLRQRQYPLALDRARIATTLEKLFQSEMLLRSDRASLPAYAFRMDLWRLWIRRQHSFWQVMRELGIEIRPSRRGVRWAIGGGIALATMVIVLGWGLRPKGRGPDAPGPPAPTARFVLEVQPPGAMIRLDGRAMGTGLFSEAIAADRDHRFHLSAVGFADSEIVVRIAAGDSGSRHVQLRELLGDLRIETEPAGAEIAVDGRRVGRSPVTVRGLGVAGLRRVSASLAGYGPVDHDANVRPDTLTSVALNLERGNAELYVISEPSRGELRLDGAPRGTTPAHLRLVPFGRRTFVVSREGYQRAETTLVVGQHTREVRLALLPEPPGTLVVKGDLAKRIYIGGELVRENVPTGTRELRSGTHQIRVILPSGEEVARSVTVGPGERVTFDYSTGAVTRSPRGGP